MEKYLPIGTVVRLKGGMKNLMIFGRIQKAESSGKVYDYVSCLYPEGNIDRRHTYLFNEVDIDEIVYMGYVDETEMELKKKIREVHYK